MNATSTMNQDMLTSQRLRALILARVMLRCPSSEVEALSKEALLERLAEVGGWPEVFGCGEQLRAMTQHPIFAAILAAPDAVGLLSRWMLLERFGHTHNRTRFIDAPQGYDVALVHEVSGAPGRPTVWSDVFIWGALISLLEAAGFEVERASSLAPDGQPALTLYPLSSSSASPSTISPDESARLAISLSPRAAEPPVALVPLCQGSLSDALLGMMLQDPLGDWRLSRCAALTHHSTRSLQRALKAQGATLQGLARRARCDRALSLMSGWPELSLTQVAFCAGFSDQAHFSREFKRAVGMSPSRFRASLGQQL